MARITTVPETGSTNADLIGLAAKGWEEGHWLRAERQSAGRGRMGRDWQAPEGNLQASTLVRLRVGDPPVTGLGLLAGVALHQAVAALASDARLLLKWPNDLMSGQAKLAGILLERVGEAVIVGVGVNIRSAPSIAGRETVALASLSGGSRIVAADIMVALAERFDFWLARWRGEGFESVRTAWLSAAHPTGTRLSVSLDAQSRLEGRFEGVAEDGALLLGLDDGSRRQVHSGEVGLL